MDPGTANTSRPWSAARRAVTREPLRSAASTTRTPSESPLMIRLRHGKFQGIGAVSKGNSDTSAPCPAMRSARERWPAG